MFSLMTPLLLSRVFLATSYLICERGCDILDTHAPLVAIYAKIVHIVFLLLFGYKETSTTKNQFKITRNVGLALFFSMLEITWKVNVYNEECYESSKNEDLIATIVDEQNPYKVEWTYLSVAFLVFKERKALNANIKSLYMLIGLGLIFKKVLKIIKKHKEKKSKFKVGLVGYLFLEQLSFYFNSDQESVVLVIFKAFVYEAYELLCLSRSFKIRQLKEISEEKILSIDKEHKAETQNKTVMLLNIIGYILANLMMFYYEWTDALDLNLHIMGVIIEILILSSLKIYLYYNKKNSFKQPKK